PDPGGWALPPSLSRPDSVRPASPARASTTAERPDSHPREPRPLGSLRRPPFRRPCPDADVKAYVRTHANRRAGRTGRNHHADAAVLRIPWAAARAADGQRTPDL